MKKRKRLLFIVYCSKIIKLSCNFLLVQENMRRQAEAAEEKEMLIRKIEENKRIEKEQADRTQQKNLRYQDDLLGQISYNKNMLALEQVHLLLLVPKNIKYYTDVLLCRFVPCIYFENVNSLVLMIMHHPYVVWFPYLIHKLELH